MKLKNWVFLSLIVLIVFACSSGNDEEPIPPLDPDLGKSYFFLEEGKYREYNVYEINYDAVLISDTSEYQIREEVGEAFENGSGQVSRLLNRYKRDDETQPWQLDEVWMARIEGDKAIVVEDNVPLVKMIFPADTTRRWDGNLLNSRSANVQKYLDFNGQFTVGLNTFLKTTEIEISNLDDGIVERDVRREVYRDSIGLIYKFYNVVTYCTSNCPPSDETLVQSGRFYREELIAHGTIDEED